MIWLWRKFTLWDYGTDDDPPDIPMIGWIVAAIVLMGLFLAMDIGAAVGF